MMASGRRAVVAVAGYRVQSLLNGQRRGLKYYVPAQRREGFEKVSFGHTAKEAPA
jgi:hypothetical protein